MLRQITGPANTCEDSRTALIGMTTVRNGQPGRSRAVLFDVTYAIHYHPQALLHS